MNAENARIDSISSPKNSTRSGSSPGRREDVDDAAANSELAAVVDALDARVAGERERLRQGLDAELGARAQLDRLRTRRRRRHRLGERARRGAHEPAAGKDVEGAGCARRRGAAAARGPSPSRRRGWAGSRRARRPGTRRPPRRRRARPRPRAEGRSSPRSRRSCSVASRSGSAASTDAGAGRHRVRELADALVLDELADEGVKDWAVHDEWRNSRSAGVMVVALRCAASTGALARCDRGRTCGSPGRSRRRGRRRSLASRGRARRRSAGRATSSTGRQTPARRCRRGDGRCRSGRRSGRCRSQTTTKDR